MSKLTIKVPKEYLYELDGYDVRRLVSKPGEEYKTEDPFWDNPKNFRAVLAETISGNAGYEEWALHHKEIGIKKKFRHDMSLFLPLFMMTEVALTNDYFIDRHGFCIGSKKVDDKHFEFSLYFKAGEAGIALGNQSKILDSLKEDLERAISGAYGRAKNNFDVTFIG